jgi:membrane protein
VSVGGTVKAAWRRLWAATREAGARLIRSASRAAGKYSRDHCSQLAAAIAYHVLFSLVPLLIFLVSIFGLLLQNDERRSELIDKIVDSFPLAQDAGIDLERILSNIPTPVSVAGLISIVAFLWTASGAMAAIRIGVTAAFDDWPGRPFFASKFVDFLLVLGIGAIILVSFGLSIVVHAVERLSDDVAEALGAAGFGVGGALGVIVPFALIFGAFTLLYHFVPPSRPRVRDVWVAGLVAALGFQAVNVGFSFYLATIATYNVLYGSLGSLFAFLFAVFLCASVLLFGAELAFQWPRSGEPDEPETETVAAGEPQAWYQRLFEAIRGLFVRR